MLSKAFAPIQALDGQITSVRCRHFSPSSGQAQQCLDACPPSSHLRWLQSTPESNISQHPSLEWKHLAEQAWERKEGFRAMLHMLLAQRHSTATALPFCSKALVTLQEACICATECVLLPGYLLGPVLVDAIDRNGMCMQWWGELSRRKVSELRRQLPCHPASSWDLWLRRNPSVALLLSPQVNFSFLCVKTAEIAKKIKNKNPTHFSVPMSQLSGWDLKRKKRWCSHQMKRQAP